jgi:hypothetical protein
MKTKATVKRDPENEWVVCSDDDGAVIYENEKDALLAKKNWEKVGANGVSGPFRINRSALDKAAPELYAACKAAYQVLKKIPGGVSPSFNAAYSCLLAIAKAERKKPHA